MSPMLIRRLVAGLSLAAAIAAPSAMSKQPPSGGGKAPQAPVQATVKISLGKLKAGKAPIYGTVPVYGTVEPFAPGQSVDVTFYLDGHKLFKRAVKVRQGSGRAGVFKSSIRVREAGKY